MKNQYFNERNVSCSLNMSPLSLSHSLFFPPSPSLSVSLSLSSSPSFQWGIFCPQGDIALNVKDWWSPTENVATTSICLATILKPFTGCWPGSKDLSILLTIWLFLSMLFPLGNKASELKPYETYAKRLYIFIQCLIFKVGHVIPLSKATFP